MLIIHVNIHVLFPYQCKLWIQSFEWQEEKKCINDDRIFVKDNQEYKIICVCVSSDELRLGHESSPAFGSYTAVARGHKNHNIRAQEPESGLSEETQVKCLVDQATDPNILGRTWEGWEPWM